MQNLARKIALSLSMVLAATALTLSVACAAGSAGISRQNIEDLIELGEFLARSPFSTADKAALRLWAEQDFSAATEQSVLFYRTLSDTLLPRTRKAPDDNQFRTELYLNFVDSFNQHPEYRRSPNNFLAIVNRYNPPAAEAMQRRRLLNQLILQQMQMNQALFNQSMHQYRQSSDAMTKSIRDQATRGSITLPGGVILHETDERFHAEDADGRKYDIAK